MKELSIEEKAKRYDEALIRGSRLWESDMITRENYEYIFPELKESKESEDAKIKKTISDILLIDSDEIREILDANNVLMQDIDTWLEKQGKHNRSYDSIELKFKVGDWVIFNEHHNSVYQVEKIQDLRYYLRHYTGGSMSVHIDNQLIRRWTIQDAKDGDILASELCDSIILFKGIKDDNIDFYCDYDFSEIDVPGDRFAVNNSGQHYGSVGDSKDFHPATKEQRDQLERAMKDAGISLTSTLKNKYRI